ncbi:hypothetical protein PG2006B_1472 [Bifidobacterium animalis subsp. animalis]|nr:hypothetical protein PG2006B_1472 [Bifidobacterium animalis subsp. animalis]
MTLLAGLRHDTYTDIYPAVDASNNMFSIEMSAIITVYR